MTTIGYHASHEQFTPGELLRCVEAAEQAGFGAAMCSDHFFPWSERQGQSGYAWSWLGAALQATRLGFGVVSAPGGRNHPAVLAQAGATLAEMYPGRLWMALGSGEALNEHITGDAWPPKPERNARLGEAVEIMRALWAGETVTHRGRFVCQGAKLYTRPRAPPMVVGAAVSAETAGWVGGWADALVTVNQPPDILRRVIDAFRNGGGDGKPILLQTHVSFAATEAKAVAQAFDQWRTNVFTGDVLWDLPTPAHFDDAAQFVRPDDLHRSIRISADPERHIGWLQEDAAMGFAAIYLHNVGRNQQAFIEAFGERVLPALGHADRAR